MYCIGSLVDCLVDGALSGNVSVSVRQVTLFLMIVFVALALRVAVSIAAQRMGARVSSEAA